MNCTLMPPHRDGYCDWCSRPLSGRRRRWCSDGCREEFEVNHDWNKARHAALTRDAYTCQICGVKTATELMSDWLKHPYAPEKPRLDEYLNRLDEFRMAWKKFDSEFGMFRKRFIDPIRPEVNHIDPLVGAGYGWSCHHHLVNLQTVCHRDHVRITRQQRLDRRMREAQLMAESA